MMIGPRNLGAGTHAPSGSQPESSHPQSYLGHSAGPAAHAHAPRTPAQRLIDQYERLSTPPPAVPAPQRARSTRQQQYIADRTRPVNDALRLSEMEHRREEKKRALAVLKREGRSPIRQSLRNLLSVIKKGAEGIGKRISDERPPVADAGDAGEGGVPYKGSKDALPAFPTAKAHRAEPVSASAAAPRRRMTGLLLYLSRGAQLLSPDVPGPLVWTACSVTIDGNKLAVAPFGADADAAVHEIMLRRCTDIRSLAPTQLTAEEVNVLERTPDGDTMRVFELIFDDQRRERFAAKSVRERAGWISAIWCVYCAVRPSISLASTCY